MDAHEARGVEAVLERLHRFANEVPARADDDFRVRTARPDEVHLVDGDVSHFATRLDRDPLEVARRRRGRFAVEHRAQSFAKRARLTELDVRASASERLLEALIVERLDEIIQ